MIYSNNPSIIYKLLRTVCAFEITRNMLYLQCCPTDTRQREEVSLYGNHHFFYCLLHGKHSRLLCLQMVRGRQVGQHQPSGYLSAINKQEEAPSIRTTEGFILFVYMDSSFLFAYWHYSICKMKVQYAKKVTDSQKWECALKSEITILEIPNRGMTVINESGLYSLILSSKLPSAKEFKHWVTSEV